MTDPARLLLVEDSETQALALRLMLEGEGFAVDRASTAEAALDRLNEALPDLLLVDYRLPGMNGDELVRQVRMTGRTRTLPILLFTDDTARDVERQGLDSGANAYVPKSADRALLVMRLRALLRQRRNDSEPAVPAATFRRARIGIVEPDPDCRRFLADALASDGYALTVQADGDGLDPVDLDCLVVGLTLDDAAALAFVRTLDARREASGESYEIICVADTEGDTVLAGFAAGADDIIARTTDRDLLLVRIRAVVRRKFARDEEGEAAARARAQDTQLAIARAEAAAADALAAANAELEASNARLRDTQGQLVQAAKMASLGELVAGIAHEINNPLAFILAHQATVGRLVRDAADGADPAAKLARAADRLDAMHSGLVRIQDLVVKLRRFSRLDSGAAAPTDMPQAIDGVLAILAPKLGDAIRVTRRYDAPAMLTCTPALVDQVVMNIVANAADMLVDGGEIAIATQADADNYLILIGDDGPGVPPELRPRLFEPFFTTKDVGVGTGLGLAIAYGVVRSHGGDIRVGESEKGGALFTISIPLAGHEA